MALAVGAFYRACDIVLSPSPASDAALAEIGMPAERTMRWDRGVDTSRFDPSLRDPGLFAALARTARSTCCTPGRITREKGAELLADAFGLAREREPRLHLVLAGGGPEQERLRERVGREHATFLGWLSGAALAHAYASADLFLFPSATDTFGQVILEAQASGLPTIAVAEGGPAVADRASRQRAAVRGPRRRAGRCGAGARRLAIAARAAVTRGAGLSAHPHLGAGAGAAWRGV